MCCRKTTPRSPLTAELAHTRLQAPVASSLAALQAEGGGSSTYVTAGLLLEEPPSIDHGEITDKGYINQRVVLDRRSVLVFRLYDPEAADVVRLR
jgi:feruloyl-CoA synthase